MSKKTVNFFILLIIVNISRQFFDWVLYYDVLTIILFVLFWGLIGQYFKENADFFTALMLPIALLLLGTIIMIYQNPAKLYFYYDSTEASLRSGVFDRFLMIVRFWVAGLIGTFGGVYMASRYNPNKVKSSY